MNARASRIADSLDRSVCETRVSDVERLSGSAVLCSVADSVTVCLSSAAQIPMGLLCGRVTHVLWPPSRWGRIQTTLEPAGGSARVRTSEQMREHSIPAF